MLCCYFFRMIIKIEICEVANNSDVHLQCESVELTANEEEH